ncbi:MAG TPA: hypothetical protein DCX03_02840 [Bacteroidales bacterium]|nr:hypothetical protein [Bacteroidales bacterium]HQN98362.1 manganese efflux pump MntP family protein [Bacteroidales bacterium]
MAFIYIILLAISLSFDTFAVAISCGLCLPQISFQNAIKVSLPFALVQAIMPLIGWIIGDSLEQILKDYDHWIAFSLLCFLGGRMIVTSFRKEKPLKPFNPMSLPTIMGLSVATSIDALFVGFSMALVETNLAITVISIGSVTFIAAMLGILIGKKTGAHLGKKMVMVGGIILIAIGTKILLSHILV